MERHDYYVLEENHGITVTLPESAMEAIKQTVKNKEKEEKEHD